MSSRTAWTITGSGASWKPPAGCAVLSAGTSHTGAESRHDEGMNGHMAHNPARKAARGAVRSLDALLGGPMLKPAPHLAMLGLASVLAVPANAQTAPYPTRSIEIVVSYAAGGSTD